MLVEIYFKVIVVDSSFRHFNNLGYCHHALIYGPKIVFRVIRCLYRFDKFLHG